MAAMPLLVIGMDATWRARMQRLLATRGELDWLGAFAPAQRRQSGHAFPALLLLDGDDPRIARDNRRPLLPAPRRLFFYRRTNMASLQHCVHAEGYGCLDKQSPADIVLRAVRAAESGLFVVAPGLLLQALREHGEVPQSDDPPGDWSGLTDRQREIVRWVARGMSNKQIARQLGISPETVKTHLQHVFEREGVHGRVALLANHQTEAGTKPVESGTLLRLVPR